MISKNDPRSVREFTIETSQDMTNWRTAVSSTLSDLKTCQFASNSYRNEVDNIFPELS